MLKSADRYNDLERLPEPLAEEEGLEMVMDKVKRANRSPRSRALMEAREKIRRYNENIIDDAIMDAETRGRMQGMVQGEARGRTEGVEMRSREIARTMKAERIVTSVIARVTGLTEGEIEAL